MTSFITPTSAADEPQTQSLPDMALLEYLAELVEVDGKLVGPLDMIKEPLAKPLAEQEPLAEKKPLAEQEKAPLSKNEQGNNTKNQSTPKPKDKSVTEKGQHHD